MLMKSVSNPNYLTIFVVSFVFDIVGYNGYNWPVYCGTISEMEI